jgi:hypothetical protein
MTDALVVLLVAAIVGVIGVGLGMLVIAPRLTRWTERGEDEDPEA